MLLRAGVATNVGLVRQSNEDSFLVRRGLYAICDGMGGARAGEIASEMACRGLADIDPAHTDAEGLLAAVRDVNRVILGRSMQESRLFGMGTTMTAAMAAGDKLVFVHVGDSRGYLLHDGALRQVTQDHSWVGEMIRRGELTPAEAAIHPHRSVITKVLGTEPEVDPDLFEVEVVPGDRLLLCSDGLSGMVADADIGDVLRTHEGAQQAADALVKAALAGGGEDNVTVIVVDVEAGSGEGADGDTTAVVVEAGAAAMGVSGAAAGATDAAHDEIVFGPADRGPAGPGRGGPAVGLKGVRAAARGRLAGWSPMAQRVADATAAGDGALADLPPAMAGITPVAAAAAPRSHSRRRRWLAIVLVVVVVLAVAIGGFAAVNSAVYYVGTYDGKVALYHGLPGSLLGIELSSVIEQGTATYDTLPSYVQDRIDSHELTSKEEGQKYLRSLNAVQ